MQQDDTSALESPQTSGAVSASPDVRQSQPSAQAALEATFGEELKPSEFRKKTGEIDFSEITNQAKDSLRAILQARWNDLQSPPTGLTPKEEEKWIRRRGFHLEVLLFKLLTLEGLRPSPSHYYAPIPPDEEFDDEDDGKATAKPAPKKKRGRRPGGEQIDAMFELDSKYFLVEAKWESEEMPASEIHSLTGRVGGRLIGTLGVFISVSGFADNIGIMVTQGKPINVILFDGEDLNYCFRKATFAQVLRAKLREAARTGQILYSYSQHLDTKKRS